MVSSPDELSLASEFERILSRLYIVRSPYDVPTELSAFEVMRRLFSRDSFACLSLEDQQQLLRLLPARENFERLLREGRPQLIEEARKTLGPHERSFVSVLKKISANRGSHDDLEPGENEIRLEKMRRARIALRWTLRTLGLAGHPDYPPEDLTVQEVDISLRENYRELIATAPQFASVISEWVRRLDSIKLILDRQLNRGALPQELLTGLSPECRELLEFLSTLIDSPDSSRRLFSRYGLRGARRKLAYAHLMWIFTQMDIMDDLRNPPYGLDSGRLMAQLRGSYASLDERSRLFLRERVEHFPDVRALLNTPSLPEFTHVFATLLPADQVFYSILACLDKFFREHGRYDPAEDYWYSPLYYPYIGTPDRAAAYDSRSDDYARPESRCYQGAGTAPAVNERASFGSLLKPDLGPDSETVAALIKKVLGQAGSIDALGDDEVLQGLETGERDYLKEHLGAVPLYYSLVGLKAPEREILMRSLKPEDTVFLDALLKLLPEGPVKLQLTDAFWGAGEAFEEEEAAADPEAQRRESAFALTQRLCRALKLSFPYEDRYECTDKKSLRPFFEALFSLDNFVLLDKSEQQFLFERRKSLESFLKIVTAEDKAIRQELWESLSPEDQGFLSYVGSLRHKAL